MPPRGKVTDWHSVWRFGIPTPNLGGTARTLDDVDARTPLEPGVLSQVGVTALDDSGSFLFEQDGWVGSRRARPARPLRLLLRPRPRSDPPRPPRGLRAAARAAALGARQLVEPLRRYTAGEYLALLDHFDTEGVPFSVAVLDTDWHRVDDVPPQYGSGWTCYTWDHSLFPDPPVFLAELHRRGSSGHAQRASGRRRAPVRGRVPGHGGGDGP